MYEILVYTFSLVVSYENIIVNAVDKNKNRFIKLVKYKWNQTTAKNWNNHLNLLLYKVEHRRKKLN